MARGWHNDPYRHGLAGRGIRSSGRTREHGIKISRYRRLHQVGRLEADRLLNVYKDRYPEDVESDGSLVYPENFGFMADDYIEVDTADQNLKHYTDIVGGKISDEDKETFVSAVYDSLMEMGVKKPRQVNDIFVTYGWIYRGNHPLLQGLRYR